MPQKIAKLNIRTALLDRRGPSAPWATWPSAIPRSFRTRSPQPS